MPELPDVEGFRRTLASCATGRRISRVEVADAGVLHGVSPQRLRSRLEGRTFGSPERHGKWLLAHTEAGPTLLLHFGMTGSLVCGAQGDEPHRHDRVAFTVGDRRLRYRDQRKLKGLWLADEGPGDRAVERIRAEQGPDAWSVPRAEFEDLLAARRGGLKPALTDQSLIAGLGNLLADEILWRARLHPDRRAAGLGRDELHRLHGEMRRTVRISARAGHIPAGPTWLTGSRDDLDPHCPRCCGPLGRGRTAGRATVWCPHCQQNIA